jgi:steroid delta-isomerase-like uncharacterized protein
MEDRGIIHTESIFDVERRLFRTIMKKFALLLGSSVALVGIAGHGNGPADTPTSHQTDQPQMTVSVETLQQVLAAFNRHDLDAIMSYFAEDCTFDSPRGPDPWGQRFLGKEQVRAGLSRRFQGIPDVHYGDDRHWLSGDRGVSEWTLTGSTTDGVRLEVRGCDLWEFRDGKIIRKDSFWKIVER